MPIGAAEGILEVENAKFSASEFIATTSVGIGTTSASAYPLVIFKETEPEIRIQEGDTPSSGARFYSNNSNLYIQTGTDFSSGSSGDIAFQTMGGQSTHVIVKGDGKVGVGTGSPNAKLQVNGSFHAPGTIVQVVTKQVIGNNGYTASGGSPVNLEALQTVVVPKFSNSKMVVQVYLHYEADYNAVLYIQANGVDIPGDVTYGNKQGIIAVAYDGNVSSTPSDSTFMAHHTVSSLDSVTYKVYYRVNGTSSGTIKLNRAYSVVDEQGICYVMVTEIAQ